jgi:hypothetical protein
MMNKKANNGMLAGRRAYRIRYHNNGDFLDSVEINRVDMATIPELASSLPIKQRIANYLKSGKATKADLLEELDMFDKADTLKNALNTMIQKGRVVKMGDYYALAASEHMTEQVANNPQRTTEQWWTK